MIRRSKAGRAIATSPYEWSANHTPAANTQATVTRAAGGAGVRHVLRSFDATLIGLTGSAETTILVNVRDGATGAGTILRSFRLLVIPGGLTGLALGDLNLAGSENTAMTIEFAAAAGANTFETVSMSGFSERAG